MPKASTFVATKHEANVESVNILPGKEILYFDCRVLPQYKLDEVLGVFKETASRKEFSPVKISVEIYNREDAAPPTSETSEIVRGSSPR